MQGKRFKWPRGLLDTYSVDQADAFDKSKQNGLQRLDFNTSHPGQNRRYFAVDIHICISVNDKFCILIKISLNFVPKSPVDNDPPFV